MALPAELFYLAAKKIRIGRGTLAATTFRRRAVLRCRNDGAAVILDFRPRLGNRCSYGVYFGYFRAAILDLRGSI